MTMRIRTETFLRTDIENALRAINSVSASFATEIDTPEALAYRRGFGAALAAVATAFDVEFERQEHNLTPSRYWSESTARRQLGATRGLPMLSES